MTRQIKIHDGIIGVLILVSLALAWQVDPRWLALAALVAAVMISSAFTGFCPVHFLVKRPFRD